MARCNDCKNKGSGIISTHAMQFGLESLTGFDAAITVCKAISSNPDIPFVVDAHCERKCSKFILV